MTGKRLTVRGRETERNRKTERKKRKKRKKKKGGVERKSFPTSPRTWGFSFHCCVLTDRSLALSHLPVLDCHFSLPCPPHYSPCRSPHKSNNCQPFSLKGFIACRLIVPRQNEHGFCAVHCRLLRPEVISEFSPLVHLLHMSSFGVVFWSSPLI